MPYLEPSRTICYAMYMAEKTKKVTVNLPEASLERGMAITGKGITETLVEALHELERREHRSALRRLRGKVRFDLDLEETRR